MVIASRLESNTRYIRVIRRVSGEEVGVESVCVCGGIEEEGVGEFDFSSISEEPSLRARFDSSSSELAPESLKSTVDAPSLERNTARSLPMPWHNSFISERRNNTEV